MPDALVEELRLVRRSGHAVDREEYLPGVICVGAAIRNHLGAVVGAISASAPALRATQGHMARMREGVTDAARELSAAFDAHGPEAIPLAEPRHP